MSLFPASYFAFFMVLMTWSFVDDIKNKVNSGRLVGEALTDAALLLVALSYWVPSVRSSLGSTASVIFGLAVVAFLFSIVATIRRRIPDPGLTPNRKAFVFVGGTTLIVLVVSPLLYWGFFAAVLHRYAGT